MTLMFAYGQRQVSVKTCPSQIRGLQFRGCRWFMFVVCVFRKLLYCKFGLSFCQLKYLIFFIFRKRNSSRHLFFIKRKSTWICFSDWFEPLSFSSCFLLSIMKEGSQKVVRLQLEVRGDMKNIPYNSVLFHVPP